MNKEWRKGAVRLVDGYAIRDAAGVEAQAVNDVEFAFEGGFVHIRVPGFDHVQVVSAPAVLGLDYKE